MMDQGVTQVANNVVDGLKAQPFVLALVVINVLFLGGVGYVLHRVSENNALISERKDALLSDLARNCVVPDQVRRPQ